MVAIRPWLLNGTYHETLAHDLLARVSVGALLHMAARARIAEQAGYSERALEDWKSSFDRRHPQYKMLLKEIEAVSQSSGRTAKYLKTRK